MMQWIDSDPERAIEELLKLPMDALIQRTLAVLYIWEKNFDKALVLAQGREREYCLYMLNNAQNKINAQINAQMDPLINAQIVICCNLAIQEPSFPRRLGHLFNPFHTPWHCEPLGLPCSY
jgi:hypothetical protein